MYDINFYTPFHTEKALAEKSGIPVLKIAVLVGALMIGYFAFLIVQYTMLKNESSDISAKLTSDQLVKGLEDYKVVQQQLATTQGAIDWSKDVVATIDSYPKLHEKELLEIAKIMPLEITVNKMSIEKTVAKIEGESTTLDAISDFVNSINRSTIVKHPYVSDITHDTMRNSYTFNLQLVIGE